MIDKSVPHLQFVQSGSTEGFSNSTVSGENVSNVAEIVRELIQNSTDAVREAGRSETRIHFVFDKIPTSDIPGIRDYGVALRSCRETHSENLETAEAILEQIDKQLNQENMPVLDVYDNGIGLNTERMNRLLGDGITSKTQNQSNSGGSYGVGHLSAFTASDLRYVLYGGITDNGAKTMSGHAILASHFPPPARTTANIYS